MKQFATVIADPILRLAVCLGVFCLVRTDLNGGPAVETVKIGVVVSKTGDFQP